jgi:hypothetical protein
MKKIVKNRETPWGMSENAEQIVEGITWYDTPSHGGFYVEEHLNKFIKKYYPSFTPFAGEGWYEEDCDCALVIKCFPQYFSPAQYSAAKNAIDSNPAYYQKGKL